MKKKKCAILRTYENDIDSSKQKWEVYEEFDDIDEAIDCFRSIAPNYNHLTWSVGKHYNFCEIYRLVMRYLDSDDGNIYDCILKVNYIYY